MRTVVALVVAVAMSCFVTVTPAHAERVGNEGCTPGYWKNHPGNWEEATPDQTLHFTLTRTAVDLNSTAGADTFMDALNYKGGSGVDGATRILLRAAVAAYLNAAHEGLGYPLRRYADTQAGAALVKSVKDAIDSGDRQRMLDLAAELDRLNNLGCPL